MPHIYNYTDRDDYKHYGFAWFLCCLEARAELNYNVIKNTDERPEPISSDDIIFQRNPSPTSTFKIRRSWEDVNNTKSFKLRFQYSNNNRSTPMLTRHHQTENINIESLGYPYNKYRMKPIHAKTLRDLDREAAKVNLDFCIGNEHRLTLSRKNWGDHNSYDWLGDFDVREYINKFKHQIKYTRVISGWFQNDKNRKRNEFGKKTEEFLTGVFGYPAGYNYNFFKDVFSSKNKEKPKTKQPSAPSHDLMTSPTMFPARRPQSSRRTISRTIPLRSQNGNTTNINLNFNINVGKAFCGIL